jgi:hypothetical protein
MALIFFGYVLACPAKSTFATNVANFLLPAAFCRDFSLLTDFDLQNYRIFTEFTEYRKLKKSLSAPATLTALG